MPKRIINIGKLNANKKKVSLKFFKTKRKNKLKKKKDIIKFFKKTPSVPRKI
jgi:hypothetical protein